MALIICEECGKEFSDRANACPNCGCPNETVNNTIVVKSNALPVTQDKVPHEKVVQHLKYAAQLETTLFTFKTTYNKIEQKICSLGHNRNIDPPAKAQYDFPFWRTFFISFAILLILSGAILMDFGIAFGIAIAGGIIHIARKNSAHNALVKVYKKEVLADKERVSKEKEMIVKLRQEQNIVSEQIQNTSMLLENLYSLDIIFPTYRHMVAILTILEYFESGRCSQLTGGHGAYDTYSTEEKQNKIIGKLDVVINMLDDIRYNQSMLYESIQEANDTANRIYAQSERIIETNGKIAENTALTAYNTDIIRQNTTISAYIDVFGYKQ